MIVPTTGSSSLAERAAFADPDFYALKLTEIEEVVASLHREAPVFWCEAGGFWVISKYKDQRFISSNPELFSSSSGFTLADNSDPAEVVQQLPQWAQDTYAGGSLSRAESRGLISRSKLSLGDPELINIITSDPPLHTYQRKIWAQAFGARLIRRMGATVKETCDELLDAIEPGSVGDFVDAVVEPLPTLLTADIMGVPRSDRPRFVPWAKAQVESISLTPESPPDDVARITRQIEEFFEYNGALIEKRRAEPQDDFISRVVNSDVEGRTIDESNAMMFVSSLFGGASDTSKSLIGQAIMALGKRPEQRAKLIEQPDLLNNAVEEVLRYHPVAWAMYRTATAAVEIGGQAIGKDDYLMLFYFGANRDEEVWDRPFDFDVGRTFDSSHMSFGFGEHTCPGSALARIEGRTIVERMLTRFPNWELVGAPETRPSSFIHQLKSMEVRFQ